MKPVSNHDHHVRFTALILAVFVELALPTMGQVPAPVPKVVLATAVTRPLPGEGPTEPRAMQLSTRSFFVEPYQFHEVIRAKLPTLEENKLDGTGVNRSLLQWLAQLGVEMTNGKSIFWHDDGRLLVRASPADLDTIEAAIVTMGKEYSGKPHPRLEIRVFYLAPDAFEEGLRKLGLVPQAATNSLDEVGAAVFRRCAELGVDLAPPKTFHYDRSRGYLALCATRADLEIVESEVARLQVTPGQPPLRKK